MSNAMRFGKRSLAGVAAGALALGMLTVAGASSASAAPSIKPKATGNGTASAVRFTGTTGTRNTTIPASYLSFAKASYTSLAAGAAVFKLINAPSATAKVFIDDTTGTAITNNYVDLTNVASGSDDTAIIAGTMWQGTTGVTQNVSADDSYIRIGVDTAGSYTARLQNGTDTVTFTWTTTGAPTSMTLTPATATILVGGVQDMTVKLLDASGNQTQPTTADSVTVGASRGTPTAAAPTTLSVGGNTALNDGAAVVEYAGAGTAGSATVTATPFGTLGATGVTAQTATITESGSISDDTIANWTVTAPANALRTSGVAASSQSVAYQVPAGTTTVTVKIDDTTINTAGQVVRLAAVVSSGTVNGVATSVTPLYVDLTTDANKSASTTFTLGGAAINANQTLTVSQVNVINTSAGIGGDTKVTITQKQPTVTAGDITVSPDDSNVAALGATTTVTVQVDDSFLTPQSGWVVRAFRGPNASSGTPVYLSQGTTNAAGTATVTVTNAASAVSGTVEQYSFTATPPVGSAVDVNNALQITYSTSGGVTGVSVVVTDPGGTTTPITNTTTSILVMPYILVPAGGVVATAGTGTYTVATAAGTAGGNYTTFTPTATPLNAVTVTAPEGVKLLTATQLAAGALWSGGAQTLTVGSAEAVHVFGTKVGEHEITFTSGGITTKTKVKIATAPQFAYNIDITPKKQDVGPGGFATATVKVTDVFGNAVAGTSDDTGGVTVTATGEVRLGGFQASQKVNTDTTGSATVTVIAGNTPGAGLLTATPTNATAGSNAPAYRPLYVKPLGAPSPVLSSTAEVTVTAAPVTKTITITGSRTTVSGKPGIMVDGITTGIEDGKTVIPFFRFPGETSYTEGSARPVITDNEFTWQRKTGKKFYAYVTNDDGSVQSNRVIIPAN